MDSTVDGTGDSGMERTHRIAGRYLLLGSLGGTAEDTARAAGDTVWAARDEVLGREVAVSRVGAAGGHPAGRQRVDQARAAARIVSPHIVQIFDVVQDGGHSWLVMELIPGRSLRSVLAERGPLAPADVVLLGQQLVLALTAARAHGLLHLRITPATVLLRADGTAVLTDVGLDAATPDAGTPDTGTQDTAGEASEDLHSLGRTLHAAAYGERSAPAGNVAPSRAEDLVVPAGPLGPVLRGLLAPNPALRISTETTRLMLLAAAAGVAAASPPAPHPVPRSPAAAVTRTGTGRHRGRRRGRVLVVAVAALIAAGATTTAVVLADDTPVQQAGRTADVPTPSGPGSAGPGTAAPTTTAPTTTAPTAETAAPGPVDPPADSEPDPAVPAGFRLHVDETGFAVAVPTDWTVSRDGSRTDFVEPGGGRFLRIDQTQTPKADPVADWQAQEAGVSARLGGYARIRIEPVDYRDYDAADWEFTWRADSGDLHVLNRNTITGPNRAYAIYWSTPDAVWADSLPVFDVITDSFAPAA